MGVRSEIRRFLEPESIAVIGASRRLGNGSNVLENLLVRGFRGSIYPVNPNAQEICGINTYADVEHLPDNVDLAVILTPRDLVVEIVKKCGQKGIRAVIIVGAGYSDAGEAGKTLELRVVEMASRYGIRIVGPNTFGVANGFMGLYTAFAPFPCEKIPVGSISQTGLFFANTSRFKMVGKAVDLGNACDVSFSDVLEYFEEDQDIRMIVIYLESIREGRQFIEVASRVSKKKPIFVLKGGKSEQGTRLVSSHTGALAGGHEIYDAVFKQCGITQVNSVEEFEDVFPAFLSLPLAKGRGVGIMTYPMSAGVLSVDACQRYGLKAPELAEETLNKIGLLFPSWAPCRNPVDLAAAVFVMGQEGKKCFEMIMDALLCDPKIDAVLFNSLATPDYDFYDYSEIVLRLSGVHRDKPIVSWLYGPDPYGKMARKYEEKGGVVVFPSLERALKTIRVMWDYRNFLSRRDVAFC